MRNLIIGVVLGALFVGAFVRAGGTTTVKTWKVGIGKPATSGKLTASATGGSLAVTRGESCTQPDGSAFIILNYANGAGQQVATRTISFPANRTQSVVDQFGNTIAATVPASTGTNIDSFGSNLDTQIGNAAGAGKLNL